MRFYHVDVFTSGPYTYAPLATAPVAEAKQFCI
jgi:hypothetical protein